MSGIEIIDEKEEENKSTNQEIKNLKQSIRVLRDIVDKNYGRLKRDIEDIKKRLE